MNFDRLAPHYDWMEFVLAGRLLDRVRTTWLDELHACRRILSLGEGHGRFAAACAARFPEAGITCVEASAPMLARARNRLGNREARVSWEHADAHTWPPRETFDAIVTCFFLDCLPPPALAALVAKFARCTTRGAVWLVADFAVPSRGPKRWRAQTVHQIMYRFFRHAANLPARRLTPPDSALRANGFQLAGRREFDWGLLRADLWRRVEA